MLHDVQAPILAAVNAAQSGSTASAGSCVVPARPAVSPSAQNLHLHHQRTKRSIAVSHDAVRVIKCAPSAYPDLAALHQRVNIGARWHIKPIWRMKRVAHSASNNLIHAASCAGVGSTPREAAAFAARTAWTSSLI